MTVKNITLLSIEECQKYKPVIPLIKGNWWWLRSPGVTQDFATGVNSVGNIDEYFYVNYNNTSVRPALEFNLDTSDNLFWYKPEKLIGTKIKYGNYNWTVLDMEFGELYALCDELIAQRRFDLESNDWDKSELKQWLETEGLSLISEQ